MTLGVHGALAGDPDTAASFNGTTTRPRPAQPLRHHQADGRVLAEVERLRQRRRPRLGADPELQQQRSAASWSTPTPLSKAGKFGVGIGSGATRNNAFFARPSAGLAPLRLRVRHHRAGRDSRSRPTSTASRWPSRRRQAAPAPATSPTRTLYFMSRRRQRPVRRRALDEVALYNRALDRVDDRRSTSARNQHRPRPPRSPPLRTRPRPARPSAFNASASSDPDGTIAKYEWDLDGNGTL